MPIYEYRCDVCHHHFELFTHSNDRDNVTCPNCHAKQIKRLVSTLGFMKHPDQANSSVSCCESKSSCETKGSCCSNQGKK